MATTSNNNEQPTQLPANLTPELVRAFTSTLVGACPSLVSLREQRIVRDIPPMILARVFNEVFGGDLALARDIMYNRFDRIQDGPAEKEVENIVTLDRASQWLTDAVLQSTPVLVISDVDNDGALCQAMSMEYSRLVNHPMSVESKAYDPEIHGFSVPHINEWLKSEGLSADSNFLVMVADLGTNQREQQAQFISSFPNGKLVIADHHEPDADEMVFHNHPQSLLVSPYVQGSFSLAVKEGGGVSGGYLMYAIIKKSLSALREADYLKMTDLEFKNRTDPLKEMGKVANLLDGVRCDIRLKPLNQDDVSKALDVASNTRIGRGMGRWLPQDQDGSIRQLLSNMGVEGVQVLLDCRRNLLECNHRARALFEILPDVLNYSEERKMDVNVAESMLIKIAELPIEDSCDVNYVELLRPHIFNFSYENQFEGKVKSTWLDLTQNLMRDISRTEKVIKETIRNYEFVTEISEDYALITRAAVPAVSRVFTTKELSSAYSSIGKPLNMSVMRVGQGRLVLNYNSDLSMQMLVANVSEELPGVKMTLRGHGYSGGLTMEFSPTISPFDLAKTFLGKINNEIKHQLELMPTPMAIEVKPDHLSIVREMFEKMRLHLGGSTQPTLVMRMKEDMSIEDKYSLAKHTVAELAQGRRWETTVEPLDFSMSSSLIIQNQLLSTLSSEQFKGALSIKLLPNGAFLADGVFTPSQMEKMNPAKLIIPLERDREELKKHYLKHFASKPVPAVSIPRDVAINALKFNARPEETYNAHEAIILGVLDKVQADSYIVLDVEADGAGNAQCINVGLAIYKEKAGSGTFMTEAELGRMIANAPNQVRNFKREEQGFLVNRMLDVTLVSQVINRDGSKPIRVAFKTQSLTNLTQDFLDEVGHSAEEAQQRLLATIEDAGKMVFQAHNLPYDNNIIRVNYPDFYERMKESIHLDSAPLAKNKQVAYTRVQVNKVGGFEFFNAEHPGYNLSTLLETQEDFDFPSIKGEAILQARGEVLQILNLKTRVTTQLKVDRTNLKLSLPGEMTTIASPRYSIEKLLRMATIHDMISHQPVKQVVKIPYDGFSTTPLPDDLWDHFQEHYAYDMTPAQNVAKFMVLPPVRQYVEGGDAVVFTPNDAPDALWKAVAMGSGQTTGQSRTKKGADDGDDDAPAQEMAAYSDILLANAVRFVQNNAENAERFARSWVYELVLEHHEITVKAVPKSFIAGVSDMTGVSEDMVATIYDEMYRYKEFRGIKSYRVHETHNNVGLDGDTYQEGCVFTNMLNLKESNPFLIGDMALRYNINPHQLAIDSMVKQALDSTLKQEIRNLLKVALSDDLLNSYSAKQLDNFDEEGISVAVERDGVPTMRCRSLSENGLIVNIELPEFDAETWRTMPEDDRKSLESKIEEVVTVLVLANSRNKKNLGTESKTLITNIIESPEYPVKIREMVERFGKLQPTQRDSAIKKVMSAVVSSIADGTELNIGVNKHLSSEDLDLVKSAVLTCMKLAEERVHVECPLSESSLSDVIDSAKVEYAAFEFIRNNGEKPSEDCYSDAMTGCVSRADFISKQVPSMIDAMEATILDLKTKVDEFGESKAPAAKKARRLLDEAVVGMDSLRSLSKSNLPQVMGPLRRPVKAELTKYLTAIGNVLQDFRDASPELANGVLNSKDDPAMYLLKSPVVKGLMYTLIEPIELKPEVAPDVMPEVVPEGKKLTNKERQMSLGF